MKHFREKMRRARLVVLSVLFAVTFSAVDGHLFAQLVAMERREHARLEQISERLGISVERLRGDNPGLVATLAKLVSDPEDRFQARQLERLTEVLERAQAEVDANPFRERIEAVKLEHRRDTLEGVLRDLAAVTSPGALPLRPDARRAILRNLASAFREDLVLPPLPDGLPAKAVARHREMEERLRRLARDVEPLLSKPEALSEERFGLTVADLAGAVGGSVGRPGQAAPRFRDRPLPVQRVERQAPTAAAREPDEGASTPAVVSPLASGPVARTSSSALATAGSPAPLAPIAPEIDDLAASLGNSPAKIFTWVHDNVAYDPKWGQVRSPLGTLLEKAGTSWDQAALLAELLTAAGVDARLEWGEIEISKDLLLELTGTANAADAGGVLATGGVPIVLQQIASQVVTAKLSHVWVKAHVDYIPNRGVTPGPPDTWIRMDPSFKRSTYQTGIPVHQSVPYSLGDYLQSATPLSPRRFRDEALWAYIRANNIECTTLEQLKKAGSILQEGFPYLPGTLRGKIVSVGGEDAAVPAAFRHRVRIEVKNADGASLLAREEPWAELWGARAEIAWVGATAADEATIASFGSVFDTPPYLVDLVPTVRVDGAEVARGSAIGSARGTEVWVTLLETSGEATTLTHETLAGEHHVLAIDFGRLPQRLVDDHQVALAAAIAAGDDFEAEAETLYLLGAQYMNNLGRDLDDLAGWNWQRLVKLGTEGLISQTGIVTTTLGGTPLDFRRGERNVDVARMILGIFPADGDHQYKTATFELLGSQSSYLEGEIFNQVLAREGIASVSALTRSKRAGQTLTLVDGSNVGQVLSQVDLGADAEQDIAFAVGQGKVAWVAAQQITVNQWTGTGYVLEDPQTGAAGYLISGSLAGGADTGLLDQIENVLGSESWLDASPLTDLLRQMYSLFGGDEKRAEGGGPSSNQGDPVNLSNGNFWFRESDLTVLARGTPIIWSRTYNSRSTHNHALGYGWTFAYGERLEEQLDGSVVFREDDGTEHRFQPDGGGGYVRPAGKHLTLARTATEFTLTALDGQVATFALDGRLLSSADTNGNTVTLGYDAGGNLETVVDAAGRTVLTITTSSGKITEVVDLAGRRVTYGYSGDDLTTVTDTVNQPWTYDYDDQHNLIARSDPLGNTDTYAYDALDRCIRHSDPLGNDERFAYSSIGRSAVWTDRRGFDTYLEFDNRGRSTLQVDALGNASQVGWDADNNQTSSVDARGGATTRTFDGNGNLLTETDALDETTTWTYEPVYNKIETITDASGHVITNTWDGNGNLIEQSQQVAGRTRRESFTYDAFGQVTERLDPNNQPTTFAWDSIKGSLGGVTNPLNQTTAFATDNLGRATTVTDADNNTVSFGWDGMDRIVSTTDAHNNVRSVNYDEAGRPTAVTTPRGTTQIEYDAAGRQLTLTDPFGFKSHTEYDPEGNVIGQVDSRGNRTTRSYDAVGRPLALINPLGEVWSLGYCADLGGGCGGGGCSGSPGAGYCDLTDPLGNTTQREYDALGRPIRVTDPQGNVNEIVYDALGRTTTVKDGLQNPTEFEYDEIGRLTAVVEANNARTEYSYDDNGNLVLITDAELREWPRTYDFLNRLETEADPLGNSTTYGYDLLGNLTSELTPNGDLITFDYDVRRLIAVNLPGGAQETFGYDAVGRMTTTANAEHSLSVVYDAFDRPVEVTDLTLGQTITYSYDEVGNLVRMVGPNGATEYFWDAANRLVRQVDPTTGSYSFSYDAAGRRTRLEYPNGLAMEYGYDSANRLSTILTRSAGGSVVDGYSYRYDEASNRTAMDLLHEPTSHVYQYDLNNRLIRWERGADRFEQYSYDQVGNRVQMIDEIGTVTYDYDLADRLLTEVREPTAGGSSTRSFGWDDNGNLTQTALGAQTTTLQWDALDRLVQLNDAQGLHTYGYDPRGNRVRETNGADTRRFLHAGGDIVATFDGASQLVDYYTHGPGIDEPLAQDTQEAGLSYLHRDGLGSVTALSTPAGQLAGSRAYAAFGSVEQTGPPASRYGYTGRELDPTGLMHYRARYYAPDQGRFIGRDPFQGSLEAPATQHDYVYVNNRPIDFTDPTGEVAITAQRVAGALFSAIGIKMAYNFWLYMFWAIDSLIGSQEPFAVPVPDKLFGLLLALEETILLIFAAIYITVGVQLLIIGRTRYQPRPVPEIFEIASGFALKKLLLFNIWPAAASAGCAVVLSPFLTPRSKFSGKKFALTMGFCLWGVRAFIKMATGA